MIDVRYSPKGTAYVLASQLHQELNISTPLRKWFPRMIEYGFEENIDYYPLIQKVFLKQGGYTEQKDWAIKLEMAKHIAMIQRSERGKSLRKYLIGLDESIKQGDYLNQEQLGLLFELCRVFGFFSIQEFLEKEHYDISEKKGKKWWSYRARSLGNPAVDLKEVMKSIGKKYKNQRQALFHIDKYELVRRASFDLFKALGKSDEYALNVSNFAKKIAIEIKPEIYDDRNASIDFKTKEEKQTISKIRKHKETDGLLEKFD